MNTGLDLYHDTDDTLDVSFFFKLKIYSQKSNINLMFEIISITFYDLVLYLSGN